MPELGSYGSVRGALSNERLYRALHAFRQFLASPGSADAATQPEAACRGSGTRSWQTTGNPNRRILQPAGIAVRRYPRRAPNA